jgi:hypothetical protein
MEPSTSRGARKIFLSYSHEDRRRASAVKLLLELGGADVFMDHSAIRPGAEWNPAIQHALWDCDVLCVFWSEAARRSSWVHAEYSTFIAQFPHRSCVPLCADETPLPPLLAARQAPPDVLFLANEFLALRRELAAQGVSPEEVETVVRDRMSRLGLRLDRTQWRTLLALFISGVSLGVARTRLSEIFKPSVVLALVTAVAAIVLRPSPSGTSSIEEHVGAGSVQSLPYVEPSDIHDAPEPTRSCLDLGSAHRQRMTLGLEHREDRAEPVVRRDRCSGGDLGP